MIVFINVSKLSQQMFHISPAFWFLLKENQKQFEIFG